MKLQNFYYTHNPRPVLTTSSRSTVCGIKFTFLFSSLLSLLYSLLHFVHRALPILFDAAAIDDDDDDDVRRLLFALHTF